MPQQGQPTVNFNQGQPAYQNPQQYQQQQQPVYNAQQYQPPQQGQYPTEYPTQQPGDAFQDQVHYDDAGKGLVDDSLISPRVNFIRKVYGIISVQLIFTAAVTMMSFQSPTFNNWQLVNQWTIIPAAFCNCFAMCSLFCCRDQARTTPNNYILLGIFTAGEAWLVSYITTQYDPQTVIMAATMTAALTIALTLHAFTCK